jgi:phosphate transport system ATP-binding protein
MTLNTNVNQESGKSMSTSVQPSSLASVASASPHRTESVRAQGTGLETRGIHAWFGKNHVLSDINLDFTAGSVTALIGPSGCGKSTFIRTINRMHEFIPGAAMAGEVLLDGKDIYAPGVDVTKIRLQIGMVFQKPNPFPSMTIGENVLSGLKLAQLKVDKKDELLEECLTRAGLWTEVKDRLNTHGGALSGGQQQRLCIARSVAVKPSVILLDEPTSALDPISTAKVEDLLHELKSDYTVAIVTHNMQQAARVSDFTAFMYLGELVEFGATDKIFVKPQRKETEDYITGRFG